MAGDEVAAIYFVLLAVVRRQVDVLAEQVAAGFGRHPDIEIHLSQPGEIHGARALPSSATTLSDTGSSELTGLEGSGWRPA